jgi:glyoxylase-like metal-dependent hydrolase (beta-lactamase superfamily II)
MEIVPGIHRIDGIRRANSYVIVRGDELLVIDTGWPGNAKKIMAYIARLGKKPSDVRFIIVTHAHVDHAGSAAELKKLTGAKIVAHFNDAPDLRNGKHSFTAIKGHRGFVVKLLISLIRYRATEPDIIVTDKSQIGDLEIIPTPGHTNGSICVYESGKAIFVGDAIGVDLDGNPRPIRRYNLDTVKAMDSLKMIATLDFQALLPGHHDPVVPGASQKVRHLVALYRSN